MSEKDILEILGTEIPLGQSAVVNFEVAKLHTQNDIKVPIIIERSKKPGPTVLITAGIHGDEVNGVEIVRQIIAKGINKPKIGTIICLPVINVYGFIHMDREFPDGRDLNRVFPGSKTGSLASRVAHKLMTEVVPYADLVLDFHTGGADRFNAAQIRVISKDQQLEELAEVFGAPIIYFTKNIGKSFRHACHKMGVPMLLFEGGKSFHIDDRITNTGVNGAKRVLNHLGMLRRNFKVSQPKKACVKIHNSKWVRASQSGMFKPKVRLHSSVLKGDTLGHITDPYGNSNFVVKAPVEGIVFNINESPIIYQGDAIFHLATSIST
jgi:hypothetical protein